MELCAVRNQGKEHIIVVRPGFTLFKKYPVRLNIRAARFTVDRTRVQHTTPLRAVRMYRGIKQR